MKLKIKKNVKKRSNRKYEENEWEKRRKRKEAVYTNERREMISEKNKLY